MSRIVLGTILGVLKLTEMYIYVLNSFMSPSCVCSRFIHEGSCGASSCSLLPRFLACTCSTLSCVGIYFIGLQAVLCGVYPMPIFLCPYVSVPSGAQPRVRISGSECIQLEIG